jgi:hypothetical protein
VSFKPAAALDYNWNEGASFAGLGMKCFGKQKLVKTY